MVDQVNVEITEKMGEVESKRTDGEPRTKAFRNEGSDQEGSKTTTRMGKR